VAEVAAIVVNFRRADATLRTVAELRAAGSAGLAVLVVENGSGDDSAARLRGRLDDAAELLVLDRNEGYCGAVNRGLAWAQRQGAPYVLLLNNDVRLPPRFLAPLVATLRNDPGVAAVAPTALRPDGRVWAEGGSVRALPNLVRLNAHGREPRPVTHGPEAVEFVPGACALYRRSDVEAAGGLDESYFMYWEDVVLGARLRAAGRKVVWLPWVRVVHEAGGSSGGPRSPLRKYLCALNSVRWLRAHGRPRHWLALFAFDLLLWPLSLAGGVRAAWAKLAGLFAGLRGARADARAVARWLDG
jgi:GT2 family glycosyltransferase